MLYALILTVVTGQDLVYRIPLDTYDSLTACQEAGEPVATALAASITNAYFKCEWIATF